MSTKLMTDEDLIEKLHRLGAHRQRLVSDGIHLHSELMKLLASVTEYNASARELAPPVEIEPGRHLQGTLTVLERWLRREGVLR